MAAESGFGWYVPFSELSAAPKEKNREKAYNTVSAFFTFYGILGMLGCGS